MHLWLASGTSREREPPPTAWITLVTRSFGGVRAAPSTDHQRCCPRVVHTVPELVDSASPSTSKFVEKRVDRPVGSPVSLVVPEGASQTGDTEIASRIAGQQGRFGRFFARDAEAFGPPVWDPLGET